VSWFHPLYHGVRLAIGRLKIIYLCYIKLNEDGSWRIGINCELNELIGNADLVRYIKSRRIAWIGHVMRMDDKRTPKRILQWKLIGTRTRGRPRKRWIAGIEEDLQIMGVRRWRKQGEERTEWKNITEKAKTHSAL
jgi:hypothetical protein